MRTASPWVVATMILSSAAGFAESPTPVHRAPLYWSTYEYNYVFDRAMPEKEWAANIDWVEKNLKPYGFDMVAVDGWGDEVFNGDGYRINISREWTHDYAWWSSNLQARGMRLGIYNNPLWVIKAAADAGLRIKGTDLPISSLLPDSKKGIFNWVEVDRPGAEAYVKNYIRFYADMGVRYLRVDFLSWFENGKDRYQGYEVSDPRPREQYETALRWMREACDENGILLSLVMPHLYHEAELERKYGHMIRVGEDTSEGGWFKFSQTKRGQRYDGWSQYANPFDGLTYWSCLTGRGKVLLDSDFIRLNSFDNDEERKTVVSISLIAGSALTVADQYNTIGDSLWIYQNRELLALNEDGFVGKPLTNDPTDERSQVWTGRMSNGDWIVGLFNREDDPRTRGIEFASLGVTGRLYARDLWRHEDLGPMERFSAKIPPHGCVVIRLSRSAPKAE